MMLSASKPNGSWPGLGGKPPMMAGGPPPMDAMMGGPGGPPPGPPGLDGPPGPPPGGPEGDAGGSVDGMFDKLADLAEQKGNAEASQHFRSAAESIRAGMAAIQGEGGGEAGMPPEPPGMPTKPMPIKAPMPGNNPAIRPVAGPSF